MKKKVSVTEKLRKNPYIVTTFVLALFCIVIIFGDIFEVKQMNKTENEILCSVVSSTPAWASEGKILAYGTRITNMSIDFNPFIEERIKFLYNPSCSACQKQIEYFKELDFWENYQKEGLTINCKEVLK